MGGSISKRSSEPKFIEPVGSAGDSAAGVRAGSPSPFPSLGGPDVAMDGEGMGGGAGGNTSLTAGNREIPTVFRWEHGGNGVFITGSFNNWTRRIPMHRSGNDFVYIQSLAEGRHHYKFIVDDEWRFAPDQPTVTDLTGNVNNIIDLNVAEFGEDEEDHTPWTTGTAAAALLRRRDSFADQKPYGHAVPDDEAFSKEPPLLPPQLRHIILNSPSPDLANTSLLPTPMHVSLNHLFCATIRDGIMVQSITQRYRRKFVSTVFYTVEKPIA
jgi:5'-AMP-activated protein kinase regulatory beta subunit